MRLGFHGPNYSKKAYFWQEKALRIRRAGSGDLRSIENDESCAGETLALGTNIALMMSGPSTDDLLPVFEKFQTLTSELYRHSRARSYFRYRHRFPARIAE
jgi:hypothetical protein